MLTVLNKTNVLIYLSNYFKLLKLVGYVKPSTTDRFLLFAFLVDFIDSLYPFMSIEDYQTIERVIHKVFNAGDCLLTRPVLCTEGFTVAMPLYVGALNLRITEDSDYRKTQNNKLRTA